jgi:hypothetical protein
MFYILILQKIMVNSWVPNFWWFDSYITSKDTPKDQEISSKNTFIKNILQSCLKIEELTSTLKKIILEFVFLNYLQLKR